MKLNTIYNEDCLEGMKKIPDSSVDMILCDLPYGTTNCSWDTILSFDLLWEQYSRITKKNSPIVLFGAEPFSTLVRMSNLKQYKYDWYWKKNYATGFIFSKYQPMRSIETISVFCKGTNLYNPQGIYEVKNPKVSIRKKESEDSVYKLNSLYGKEYVTKWAGYPINVLEFAKETKNRFHPTQKPTDLFDYLIKTYTKKADIVLDNCMGSGTTAISCLNTERNFIGYEQDKTYYEKSLIRIAAHKKLMESQATK